MGQISAEITRLPGSLLSGNQQFGHGNPFHEEDLPANFGNSTGAHCGKEDRRQDGGTTR